MADVSAGCDNPASSVDWPWLGKELTSWSRGPAADSPMRWMTLCVAANWIARTPQVWEGCIIGIASAVLHSSFCAEPGPDRSYLFRHAIEGVSLEGWAGLVLETDWPFFSLIESHARLMKAGSWTGQEGLFTNQELPACGDRGEDRAGHEHTVFRAATQMAEKGHFLLDGPEVVDGLNEACGQPLQHDFSSATACLLKAAVSPSVARSALVSAAEDAVMGCLAGKALLPALLQTPWPLATLLTMLQQKSAVAQSQPAAENRGLIWMPTDAPGNFATVWEQKTDVHYPWVQFVARALGPEQLVLPLPWPPNTSFQALKNEALMLLERFAVTNYPGPSNDRETWKTLCLVCKDGSQDPTTENATNFAPTEALREAPELQKFVALFGKTGRVRLSLLLPGGMIGWHPDDGVLENGRLILHVPIMTSRGALTRVGHLLLHVPEGVIHWCDYSLPHSVFNADDEVRVHLIIDVVARDNEDFLRNFLDPMEPSLREALRENALPGLPTDPEVSPYSAGPAGTAFARPLARQMSKTFALLVGQELPLLERSIWRQVAAAYLDQVAKQQPPRAASRGHGSAFTLEPPLAVVGGGVPRKATATRRPGSAGRAKAPPAKALASGVAAERSRERASTRKECNCRFCPSCRRRLHQDNMRQAIARPSMLKTGHQSEHICWLAEGRWRRFPGSRRKSRRSPRPMPMSETVEIPLDVPHLQHSRHSHRFGHVG
ncbi:unnamed protein product [Symbiodinium sp. CCMP2456]|nr:unnamed protein product [Symbiodinium sp. CCMP2456]